MNGNSVWTPERVEHLRKLNNEGLSASEIAVGLDCGVSRNAVIGKLHRLGLTLGGTPDDLTLQEKVNRATRRAVAKAKASMRANSTARTTTTTAVRRSLFKPRAPQHIPPAPEREEDIPLGQRRALFELEFYHCRWPCGDPGKPGFFFCGATAEDGPYCPTHATRAFFGASRVYISRRVA